MERKIKKINITHPFALQPIWVWLDKPSGIFLIRIQRPDGWKGSAFDKWKIVDSNAAFQDKCKEAKELGFEITEKFLSMYCELIY